MTTATATAQLEEIKKAGLELAEDSSIFDINEDGLALEFNIPLGDLDGAGCEILVEDISPEIEAILRDIIEMDCGLQNLTFDVDTLADIWTITISDFEYDSEAGL